MIEALDVGTVVNPEAARRQAEGGMLMTLGMALDEEFVVEDGVSKTDSLAKYKMIQMGDTPELEVIFVDNYDPIGPFGAKGLGKWACCRYAQRWPTPILMPPANGFAAALHKHIG